MKKMKFDEALSRLEEMTLQLERGEAGLEESVKIYEKGIEMALYCQKILTETEQKIQLLSEKTDGSLVLTPLEEKDLSDAGE